MTHARRRLGALGEDLVARYLLDLGLTILDRNWRCGDGEVDLVALDGGCLVVCEVKTRRSLDFGDPVESVTPPKVRRLRRLAVAWLAAHDLRPAAVRIDVVGVLLRPGARPLLRHLRAVEA